MCKADPERRLNIKKIKQSNWYNGLVYSEDEYAQIMKKILQQAQTKQ